MITWRQMDDLRAYAKVMASLSAKQRKHVNEIIEQIGAAQRGATSHESRSLIEKIDAPHNG